jgi:hypothetical protein
LKLKKAFPNSAADALNGVDNGRMLFRKVVPPELDGWKSVASS